MRTEQILHSLMESMQAASKPKTSAYDTTAEVRRIEGGTAWVHIPGGVDETPVRMTVNAEPGDTVQVRVSGGTAFLVGNGTAPPTDDKQANKATEIAESAKAVAATCVKNIKTIIKDVKILDTAVQEARAIADATNQHFWTDDNGAHVSTVEGEAAQGKNLLMNSLGILLRNADKILAQFSGSQVAFYDGDGNNEENVVAVFGKDGAQVGGSGGYQMLITGNALKGTNANDVEVLSVDGLGSQTYSAFEQTIDNTYNNIPNPYGVWHTLQTYEAPSMQSGSTITIRLLGLVRLNFSQHATAEEIVYFTQGTSQTSSSYDLKLSGDTYANVRIVYNGAHTFELQGKRTTNLSVHVSAVMNKISGIAYMFAPVFSFGTRFRTSNNLQGGAFSAIAGQGLIASCDDQFVTGHFNVEDTNNKYAVIVGNGSDDSNRSNAFTVDWDGNLECNNIGVYKDVWIGSTGTLSVNSGDVTKCCDFSLEAGVWVISGRVSYQAGGTAGTYRCAYLGTSSSPSSYGSAQVPGIASANTVVPVSAVISLNATTTVELSALHAAGTAINVSKPATIMRAVRIK